MKNLRRFLLLSVAISLLTGMAGGSLAFAQGENEPTGMKNVQLWVYPEYDDPRLLVMLEGQISGAEAPAEVRFLVPSAAEMYSAGSMDAQGQYTGGPPDRKPSSVPGWDEISYQVTSDTFRVEYYDPAIIGQIEKTIAYEFRWLYPITGLDVIVQQPRLASNFSVSPAGRVFQDSSGFTAYQYRYTALSDQPPLQFRIAYTKADPRPSLDIIQGASSSAVPAVIFATVLGIVIVGGLLWIRRSRRPRTRAERRQVARSEPASARRRPAPGQQARPASSQPDTAQSAGGRFCAQCGGKMGASDRFCPGCGAKRS